MLIEYSVGKDFSWMKVNFLKKNTLMDSSFEQTN